MPKADLQRYLQAGRDALLWKLEGLSEYDVRRPMTPTGTNLLGLVKHLAYVEMGYFGADVRPAGRPRPQPWIDDDGASPTGTCGRPPRSRASRSSGSTAGRGPHADATIERAAAGRPRPGARGGSPTAQAVTLHQVLVHVIAETHRHAGPRRHRPRAHRRGRRPAGGQRQPADGVDGAWWAAYRDRLERVGPGGRPAA